MIQLENREIISLEITDSQGHVVYCLQEESSPATNLSGTGKAASAVHKNRDDGGTEQDWRVAC